MLSIIILSIFQKVNINSIFINCTKIILNDIPKENTYIFTYTDYINLIQKNIIPEEAKNKIWIYNSELKDNTYIFFRRNGNNIISNDFYVQMMAIFCQNIPNLANIITEQNQKGKNLSYEEYDSIIKLSKEDFNKEFMQKVVERNNMIFANKKVEIYAKPHELFLDIHQDHLDIGTYIFLEGFPPTFSQKFFFQYNPEEKYIILHPYSLMTIKDDLEKNFPENSYILQLLQFILYFLKKKIPINSAEEKFIIEIVKKYNKFKIHNKKYLDEKKKAEDEENAQNILELISKEYPEIYQKIDNPPIKDIPKDKQSPENPQDPNKKHPQEKHYEKPLNPPKKDNPEDKIPIDNPPIKDNPEDKQSPIQGDNPPKKDIPKDKQSPENPTKGPFILMIIIILILVILIMQYFKRTKQDNQTHKQIKSI